ncbi:hypothetical protein Glove_309g136 [Diversispora epigaea]|uniref:Uncharacterized protein n=1 Tax=Diversispora epigaea TaxID=1348612 RepID=A0A397HYB3_9GLOM|nr:hypothetical protein Glove_309g136 [Diversispora epigaea]
MPNMKNNNKTAVSTNKRDGRGNRSDRGGGGSRGGKGDNERTSTDFKRHYKFNNSENEKENILSQSSDELVKELKRELLENLEVADSRLIEGKN